MTIELRAIKSKEIKSGEGGTVEGYGIVYDQEVELFKGFFEKIARGAFTRALVEDVEIKSFVNHDSSAVLSTTRSNPALTLKEDERGVYYSSPIPPTSYGKDLEINLERNNVSGSSFAFSVEDEDWEDRSDGTIHRNIKSGKLYEIGPVTNPAYVQTDASLRGVKESYEQRKAAQTTIPPPPKTDHTNENVLEIEKLKLSIENERI